MNPPFSTESSTLPSITRISDITNNSTEAVDIAGSTEKTIQLINDTTSGVFNLENSENTSVQNFSTIHPTSLGIPFISELEQNRDKSTQVNPTSVDVIFNGTYDDFSMSQKRVKKRFTNFKFPPSQAEMLSVVVRVEPNLDTFTDHFLDTIKNGLTKAYLKAKNRQLGIEKRVKQRSKRQLRRIANQTGNNTVVEVSIVYHIAAYIVY